MTTVIDFDRALEMSTDDSRSVLLGNGFSIARAGAIFNYANLLDKSGLPEQSPIRNVFRELATSDFEEVMRALEHAARIEAAYEDAAKSAQFQQDAEAVREALIRAVRAVHPDVHFEIPKDQVENCSEFLGKFEKVFTLNYDLQLYWVILRAAAKNRTDGFGTGSEVDGFRTFSETAYCSTYYLHGALHLFEGEAGDTKKRVLTGSKIIDDIAETIQRTRKLPLFVAEGTMIQKLKTINSVAYLRYCYKELKETKGHIFIFGHSVSNNDRHIYNAIFASNELKKLFFCVHNPMNDWSLLRERLAPFADRRKDIEIHYIDSATARVW